MADGYLIDGAQYAQVPADDRGLAYGDGVFRTLAVSRGVPQAWDVHMQRLAHDCQCLNLAVPNADLLAAEAGRLFAQSDGVLKIIITRGSGGRGYTPPAGQVRRILSAHAMPPHAHTPAPIDLVCSSVTLGAQPALAGVKHLNRLEQVLARAECEQQGQPDAAMYDAEGRIIATTMRNLLFQNTNGDWLTPALTRSGVAGATRQRLMNALAAAGTPVREHDIWRDDITDMRAVVACNSVGGVVAVRAIDGHVPTQSETARALCDRLL